MNSTASEIAFHLAINADGEVMQQLKQTVACPISSAVKSAYTSIGNATSSGISCKG